MKEFVQSACRGVVLMLLSTKIRLVEFSALSRLRKLFAIKVPCGSVHDVESSFLWQAKPENVEGSSVN